MIPKALLDKRLDRYVDLVADLIRLEQQCRQAGGRKQQAKRNGLRQRVKRRRSFLLQDGATEKQLEAAYIEAATITQQNLD